MDLDQIITDEYAAYNEDCVEVMRRLPDGSIDFSCYSPPFAGLYQYSSSDRDMSNCKTKEEFLENYEFCVEQIARITKPGRITAVHCTDIIGSAAMWDFPNAIIEIHARHGFHYKNRITVWKEPLKVRMRTMVKSLMHTLIVEDSTECFTAMPDYILVFKKSGDNEVPVTHEQGLTRYAGDVPVLPNIMNAYNNANGTNFGPDELWDYLVKKYKDWPDPKTNKLSHYIWQRYASSVWDDIRIDEVLEYKEARESEEEKHCHPLQLDVIDRLTTLYSNPGEVCLTPFAGVGSELYGFVSLGRKGIAAELKGTYFRQLIKNMKTVKYRYAAESQLSMF